MAIRVSGGHWPSESTAGTSHLSDWVSCWQRPSESMANTSHPILRRAPAIKVSGRHTGVDSAPAAEAAWVMPGDARGWCRLTAESRMQARGGAVLDAQRIIVQEEGACQPHWSAKAGCADAAEAGQRIGSALRRGAGGGSVSKSGN